MNIIEKAKELGQMIGDSKELERLKKAEEAQTNDKDAQALIKAYNEKRNQAAQKMKSKAVDAEGMQQLKQELQDEFNRLYENEHIKEYIEAKKAFEQLMQSVNSVISFYVTGEEKTSCSSESCSSCSGCH